MVRDNTIHCIYLSYKNNIYLTCIYDSKKLTLKKLKKKKKEFIQEVLYPKCLVMVYAKLVIKNHGLLSCFPEGSSNNFNFRIFQLHSQQGLS